MTFFFNNIIFFRRADFCNPLSAFISQTRYFIKTKRKIRLFKFKCVTNNSINIYIYIYLHTDLHTHTHTHTHTHVYIYIYIYIYIQWNSDIRELLGLDNKSLISGFGLFSLGNTGSNLGPEKISLISKFILYHGLFYPGYSVCIYIYIYLVSYPYSLSYFDNIFISLYLPMWVYLSTPLHECHVIHGQF